MAVSMEEAEKEGTDRRDFCASSAVLIAGQGGQVQGTVAFFRFHACRRVAALLAEVRKTVPADSRVAALRPALASLATRGRPPSPRCVLRGSPADDFAFVTDAVPARTSG